MKKAICVLFAGILCAALLCGCSAPEHAETVVFNENSAWPKLCVTVTYEGDDARKAKILQVVGEDPVWELMYIYPGENTRFTKDAVLFYDVNFDGEKDILLPKSKTEQGVTFTAYLWDGNKGNFVYCETFESIVNPITDAATERILSGWESGSEGTYGIYRYSKDFARFELQRDVRWQPAENGNYRFTEGIYSYQPYPSAAPVPRLLSEETAEIPAKDGAPDRDHADAERFFAENNFWRIGHAEWDASLAFWYEHLDRAE